MNINIYYGGRGVIEDPTLYVLEKIEPVLSELRVSFTRYNLYDMKNLVNRFTNRSKPQHAKKRHHKEHKQHSINHDASIYNKKPIKKKKIRVSILSPNKFYSLLVCLFL